MTHLKKSNCSSESPDRLPYFPVNIPNDQTPYWLTWQAFLPAPQVIFGLPPPIWPCDLIPAVQWLDIHGSTMKIHTGESIIIIIIMLWNSVTRLPTTLNSNKLPNCNSHQLNWSLWDRTETQQTTPPSKLSLSRGSVGLHVYIHATSSGALCSIIILSSTMENANFAPDGREYKSKNLKAERLRREKLGSRLLALRALVPIITNVTTHSPFQVPDWFLFIIFVFWILFSHLVLDEQS